MEIKEDLPGLGALLKPVRYLIKRSNLSHRLRNLVNNCLVDRKCTNRGRVVMPEGATQYKSNIYEQNAPTHNIPEDKVGGINRVGALAWNPLPLPHNSSDSSSSDSWPRARRLSKIKNPVTLGLEGFALQN